MRNGLPYAEVLTFRLAGEVLTVAAPASVSAVYLG